MLTGWDEVLFSTLGPIDLPYKEALGTIRVFQHTLTYFTNYITIDLFPLMQGYGNQNQRPYDIVISDFLLPILNGPYTMIWGWSWRCRQMNLRVNEVPIIINSNSLVSWMSGSKATESNLETSTWFLRHQLWPDFGFIAHFTCEKLRSPRETIIITEDFPW